MRREWSLIAIVAWRVTVFALIAMALQAAIVLYHYYGDNRRLADLMLDSEAEALTKGLTVTDGHIGYALPDDLTQYASRESIARVRLPTGEVLFSNCDTVCSQHLLPSDLAPPQSWLRLLTDSKPIHVAGGRTIAVNGQTVFIELVIFGDTQRVMWSVLRDELADHMALPMILMLVLTLGATLVSIHHALRGVSDAAAAAERLDPLNSSSLLPVENMPREIADLARTVNKAMSRIGDIMRAQKLYTTAIAHEIRIPLTAMKLAISKSTDTQMRKVDEDINRLSHFVTQMTDLGRLDAFDRSSFQRVDLAQIGRNVVADMAPLAYGSGKKIAFEDASSAPAFGLESLIEDAVRNLVGNAIEHTPSGTSITVSVGPGPSIRVIDSAGIESRATQMPGAPGRLKSGDRIGIGLEIVRKIVELHLGVFAISVSSGQQTVAEIVLPSGPEQES